MFVKNTMITVPIIAALCLLFSYCSEAPVPPAGQKETPPTAATAPKAKKDVFKALKAELETATQLKADIITYESIIKGIAPADFQKHTGAAYKPSYNEDPAVPAQCWIETGYGTQNACKYCHTNYLSNIKHGNAFPIGEDQILFSFPSPELNKIKWKNITHPGEIIRRLEADKQKIPQPGDADTTDYIRTDNWSAAFAKARQDGDATWNNASQKDDTYRLFPALNPNHLFPYVEKDPTAGGSHGYVDRDGFVRDNKDGYTGWRAFNFFPYAIFTPLTGSVSGVYIRLPEPFMTKDKTFDVSVYKQNLDLLEGVIKNNAPEIAVYYGDAADIKVRSGFYPVGTEFAHPLHYVDLNADGETGKGLDGLTDKDTVGYEFPGTRSRRVKEIRYMYKWKDVTVDDIGELEDDAEYTRIIGKEWHGWIDNKAGWVLSAYIENRDGQLRPQSTEELLQCLGCHSGVGNTIDAVWSFQRKLPGSGGWEEMNYGYYKKSDPQHTRLNDYQNENVGKGELEYFYSSVVGADLFGDMPDELMKELLAYIAANDLVKVLDLKNPPEKTFDDHALKNTAKAERKALLLERAKVMRHFAQAHAYLYQDKSSGEFFIKGSIFYPSEATMLGNIAGYRRIVADQSFNLGKGAFGTHADAIPFSLRSDGEVKDIHNTLIPVGAVITSRPHGADGVGTTPTGIAGVNEKGEPIDKDGKVTDVEKEPERIVGHISTGGTFDTLYNPIIIKKLKPQKDK